MLDRDGDAGGDGMAVAGFPGRWFAFAVHGETPVLLTWAPTARWHLRFLDAGGHDADPRS